MNESIDNLRYIDPQARVLNLLLQVIKAIINQYLAKFDLTKRLLFDTFFLTVWYKLCRCNL